MALVCPPSGDLCPPPIDSTRHSCECACLHCERNGTGLLAQRAALKRDYGIGQGAFYAKHLARADLWIGRRLMRDVLRTSRAAAGAAVRGRPEEALGHLRFLTGMLVGLCRMGVLLARRVPSGEDAVRRAFRGGGSPAPAATSASLERAR